MGSLLKANLLKINLLESNKRIMRWIYKTVHYQLKKEGLLGPSFLDESEIEESFNEYGKAGWELVSTMEIRDGILAIFKQPFRVARAAVPPVREERKVHPPHQAVTVEKEDRFTLVDDTDEQTNEEVGVIRIE